MLQGKITIVLIRHCETDWNLQGKLQGQSDIPLNNIGRAHAEIMVWQLASLGIGRVLSSDLLRAQETAQIIGRRLGVPVLCDRRLRECSFGSLEGMTLKEISERHGADAASYTPEKYDFRQFGGECREEVLARHSQAVGETVYSFVIYGHHLWRPNNKIIFVGHGNGLNTYLSARGEKPTLQRGEHRVLDLEYKFE